jgi:hypothetical protein
LDALDAVAEYAHEAAGFARAADIGPHGRRTAIQLDDLEVAEADVDDARSFLGHEHPVGEIGVPGDDGQPVRVGVLPNPRVAPIGAEIVHELVARYRPKRDQARQVGIDQVAGHITPPPSL